MAKSKMDKILFDLEKIGVIKLQYSKKRNIIIVKQTRFGKQVYKRMIEMGYYDK